MQRFRLPPLCAALALAALAGPVLLAGCGRSAPPRAASTALDVEVWSDTSKSFPLRVEPPAAPRVWLESVAIARPAALDAPLPGADPASLPPDSAGGPALEIDPGLKPPILRSAARLVLPSSRLRAAGAETVELDVRVSDQGDVTDARWAGGSADTSLVAAATACARAMRFHPALLGGRPVSVWCRQRFEFPGR